MSLAKILASSVGVLLTASAAQAQQIGTYTGMTKDGHTVSITVAQDPNNANLEVKALSLGGALTCQKSKESLIDIGIGIGDGNDIVGNKFSYASSDFYDVDLVTNMTFNGDRVKGKIGANVGAFDPVNGHTTLTNKVQACDSGNQAFTATLSGPAAIRPSTAAAMTISDGKSVVTIGEGPAR